MAPRRDIAVIIDGHLKHGHSGSASQIFIEHEGLDPVQLSSGHRRRRSSLPIE
ncbi:MAG: hypothetical protein Q8K32_06995 [Archangium sp.]|nr:hypothetical protein [Archangium sp.]